MNNLKVSKNTLIYIRKALSINELIIGIVITSILATISITTYNKITEKSSEELSLIEASALAKIAIKNATLENRDKIKSEDFQENDLDYFHNETQLAVDRMYYQEGRGIYWLFNSTYDILVNIYEDGSVQLNLKRDSEKVKLSSQEGITPNVSNLNIYCIPDELMLCTNRESEQALYLSWSSDNQSSYKITTTPMTTRGMVSSTSNTTREAYLGMANLETEYKVSITVYSTNDHTGPSANLVLLYKPKAINYIKFNDLSETSISQNGIFKDLKNKLTIQRTILKTNLKFEEENWKKITIEHNNNSFNLALSDESNKSRYLYRVNPNQIDINLPSTNEIKLIIEYNDNIAYKYLFS